MELHISSVTGQPPYEYFTMDFVQEEGAAVFVQTAHLQDLRHFWGELGNALNKAEKANAEWQAVQDEAAAIAAAENEGLASVDFDEFEAAVEHDLREYDDGQDDE
jgi:hypothetical protein